MAESMNLVDLEGPPRVRRPGDFERLGENGPPRVRARGGGNFKNGKPKVETYTRASNLASYGEQRYLLERWSERMVLIGSLLMVRDGELVEPLDPDDGKLADQIVARAKHLAGANLAAERGTSFHEQLHALHDVERAEQSVIDRLPELGFPAPVTDALIDAYQVALDRWGLTILGSEVKCVDDEWHCAGTLDAIAQLDRDLEFGGLTNPEISIIPAGTIVVLDYKTGKLRVQGGRPVYWNGYSVQVASYAQSVPYVIEPDDEYRGEWPWEISQEHALILHIDIAGALDTDVATCTLWYVDLAIGRALGNLCVEVREAGHWVPPFEQLDSGPVATTVNWGDQQSLLELALEASLRVEIREWLQGRIDTAGRTERHDPAAKFCRCARCDLQRRWPDGCPPLRSSDAHTDEQLLAIEAVLDHVETTHSLPFPAERPGREKPKSWLAQILDIFPNTTIQEQNPCPNQ
jgi:hypothetical protein